MEKNSFSSDPSLAQELGLLLFLNSRFICRRYDVTENRGKPEVLDDLIILQKLSSRFTLESHCNGLLFFVRYGIPEDIFIYNPFRPGVSQTLPQITTMEEEPMRFKQKYALGFSPSTEEYKVVRVSNHPSFRAMIHTLGTTSWRDIVSIPPSPIYGKPVYADGALHWKIDTSYGSNTMEHRIVSFDLGREEFFVTSHPNLGSERNELIDLIEWRGCLAIVDFSFNTHIDIWVMKDNINKKWVREYRMRVKAHDGEADNSEFQVISPWGDGEILLSLREDQFFSYDPKTDQPTYIHVAELRKTISEETYRTRSLLRCLDAGGLSPLTII
ncbi:F-box associated domain [Macleaya cordata]|uniref:F-box associated domain n=1 Tax=Macleaya cordata TaxID=56857 RepID=A0A200QFP1_MACCD|nr:F-box associated domain [Macleaya cordata]